MICDECLQDKPDTMPRAGVKLGDKKTPKLCTECCSTKPGREWMRSAAR